MADQKLELSRRKILGATGAVGAAGAAAGLGTSALFSDTESFTNNSIEAGTLDLVVDYVTTVTQDGVSTTSTTNDGTIDGGESGEYQIADARPGDSGFLAFCPKIVDNPGWLFVGSAAGVTDYENGQTEPEEDVDPSGGGSLGSSQSGQGAGELSEAIQVDVEYCEPNTSDPQGPDDYDTIREFNNPDDYTLADLFKELESGFLLDGAPDTSGGDPPGTQEYPSSPNQSTQNGPCLCINWDIPVEVGNEIQSDAVEFDITFAARQWRNNPNPENPIADATVHPGDSIQSAIDSASSEAVISVFGGDFGDGSDYSNIDIQKSLTLARASAERPKIVGGVFVDDTTGVVVDGFEVEREVAKAQGVFQLGAASGGPGPNDVAVADMTICNNIITVIPAGAAEMGAIYIEDVDGLEVYNNTITSSGGNGAIVRALLQGRLSTEDLIFNSNTIETVFGIFLDGVDKGGFTYEVDATITNNEFVNNNQSVRADGPDAEADINNNLFNGTTGAYVVNNNGAQLPLSDILNNNNNTFTPNGTIDNTILDGAIVPQ